MLACALINGLLLEADHGSGGGTVDDGTVDEGTVGCRLVGFISQSVGSL